MVYLSYILMVVGLSLQVAVLAAMIRGHWKRVPALFAYCLIVFLGTVIHFAALFDRGVWTKSTVKFYWVTEAIQQLLLFAALAAMILRTQGRTGRSAMRMAIIPLACLVTGVSLWAHQHASLSLWMTGFNRDLSFVLVVLNLVLWMSLSRGGDRLLLALCSAIGIQMAGQAIGHALRTLAPVMVWPGNLFIIGGHLLCFYFLWRAFASHSPSQVRPLVPASGG
jgi:hypothetical protein